MKNLSLFFLLEILLYSNLYSQQNWIDNCDHIPIHSTVWTGWLNASGANGAIDSMKKAGVEVLTPEAINNDILQQFIQIDSGFVLLPGMAITGSDTLDYINHYTNARYTVWEAEGTDSSVSNAMLEYEDSLMTPVGNYIQLIDSVADYSGIELIKGPYFMQFVYSPVKKNRWQNNYYYLTDYNAQFNLRLISNKNLPDTINGSTPICIIQVTQSILSDPLILPGWDFECTYIVKQDTLRRTDFSLNQFKEFTLSYKLDSTECSAGDTNNFTGLLKRDYVQYKVIWLGQSNYLLGIDKVVVSDQSGSDLKRSDPITFSNIRAQDNVVSSSQYWNFVTGWNGADEPHTIDQFEPIRIVDSLLNSETNYKRPTWYPLVGAWDGVWNEKANPWGTYHLSIWDELKKRVGPMNVWQDSYFLDTPFMNNLPTYIDPYGCGCDDYRVKNIEIAARNFEQAYNISPNFGASIQCGEIKNWAANQRNISSRELLYEVNLALLYGAKFISLYTYFAHDSITATISRPGEGVGVGGVEHGIVDFTKTGNTFKMIYTPKYYTLRDTISPRLKGLFGKTIKQLIPDSTKILGKNILTHPDYSGTYSYIDYIESTGGEIDTCIIDLGLFTDPADNSARHFMPLNRYYSTLSSLIFGLKDLAYYKNWRITDLIDTSFTSLVAIDEKVEFIDTIFPGDAKFYSVYPVIRKGGTIAANDTVFFNTTLSDNININGGKTLFIKAGKFYTIQDTITLQGTGSTISGAGYIEVVTGGEVNIYNWSNSLFKGKQNNHPKLYWGKFTGTGHTGYKVYRKKETTQFVEIKSLSSATRSYIDTTITVIDGQSQANEVQAEYYVKAVYNNGSSTSNSNTILYQRVEGSAQEKMNSGFILDNFNYILEQNYPNPFNPITQINYSLEKDGLVELEVLNILGERVAKLVNEFQTMGNHNITFDASSLASGVYVYKLQAGDFVSSKKMLLLK